MPSLPRDYTVVRKGKSCQVTVQDTEHLIRLRSELDLVARAAAETGPEVAAALAERADRLGDENIRELQQIIEHAHDPINAAAAAQIDADFPSLRQQMEMDVIEREARQIRDDIARHAGGGLAEAASEGETAAMTSPDGASSEPQAPDAPDAPGEIDAQLADLEGALEDMDAAQNVESALEEMETAFEELATDVAGPEGSPPGSTASEVDEVTASGESASVKDAAISGVSAVAEGPAAAQHAACKPVPVDPLCVTRVETFDLPEGAETTADPPETALIDPADGGGLVDEIEASFNHLGQFFVLHANRLWREARQKLEEAAQFAEQTRAAQDRAQAMLADVEAWRAKAAEAAETAQVHCREAASCRDEARQALEGAAREPSKSRPPTGQTRTRTKQSRKGAKRKRRPSR